jgi:hypothetical protein
MKKTKDETIDMIAKFIEELRSTTLNNWVGVKDFSPGLWFDKEGVTDKGFPTRIMDYLSTNVISRDGARSGTSYKWKDNTRTDYKYLAECAYDAYRKWINEHKLPIPEKNPVIEEKILPSKRFGIDDVAFIIFKNRIRKIVVVGIRKDPPFDKTAEIIVTCWNPDILKESLNSTIELRVQEVFSSLESILKFLTLTSK